MTFLKRHKRTPLHKKKRREKDFRARFVFLYHHTTFANSTGERASHRRRERGLNRAKTRSTHAVWRRRERFRGRKIITTFVFSAFRRDDDINQCAIESTYNNRNRKRLKKWRRNESRKSLWCVVLLLFSRGENVVRFFPASESSRTGRVASRARGLGFRVVFDEFFSFRHFFLFSLERVVFVVSFYASSRRARKLWRRRRRRRRRSKNGRTQQTMWKNDFDEMTFRFCCTRFRSP